MIARTAPLLAALALVAACGPATEPLPSAIDDPGYVAHREAALDAFRDGRLDEGLAEAEQALHAAPGAAQPWSLLSEAYARSRRHADAVATFERLAQAYPGSALAPFHRGWHLIRLERPAEARESLERALELDPDLVNAHASLAQVLLADARYDEAIEHLRRARELDPSARRSGDLVTALREAGRADEALELAVDAGERFGDDAEFPFAVGVLRVERGDDAGAEKAFREAVRRDPDHDRAQYELGLLLLRTDREDEGAYRVSFAQRLRDYNPTYERLSARATALPDEPEVPLKLAELDMTLARRDAAMLWLAIAEKRGADARVVAAERAWIHFSKRDTEAGEAELRALGDATFPRALLARAAGAAVEGDAARASRLLDRAIAEGPAERSFLRRCADLASTLGREDDAARLHERAATVSLP